MRTKKIQTGPNKFRTVWIASGSERRAYVRLARQLAKFERELATRQGVASVAHGFVAGRSPMTMASAHVGYDVTVSLDISTWFESITQDQLEAAGISPARAQRCCPGGRLRQGLPTSPAAANIAGVALDKAIVTEFSVGCMLVVYTRYADDLTLSWHTIDPHYTASYVIDAIRRKVGSFGWDLNDRKTRVQCASSGRRIICGLSVGETDVRATRQVRHRLRACQHARPGDPETRGLAEWAACKIPGSGASAAHVIRTLSRGD